MSVEGPDHGADESVKRENAERLLADLADVTLLLVGAYAAKVLPHLLPHPSITLPPDFLRDIGHLGTVYGSMIDWANEAVEHAGEPQPHRPASKPVPIFDFKRLNQLDRQEVQGLIALGNAWLSVGETARQLAAISPQDRAGQVKARQVLSNAIRQLIAASARLMQLDADIRAANADAHRQESVSSPPGAVLKLSEHLPGGPSAPIVPAEPGRRPASPKVTPTSMLPQLRQHLDRAKRQLGSGPASDQAPGRSGGTPSSGF